MPSFGPKSKRVLAECEQDIQDVLNEAIKHIDFSCIWGHRGKEDQNAAFRDGFSTVEWPNSKHNKTPARAVDIIPYPGGFDNDDEAFFLLATYVLRAANELGVDLVWGGHWRSFKDLAHFELRTE
jgi:peptidoglycan L-alanyl-D-glutamate endopeptidase CwlK